MTKEVPPSTDVVELRVGDDNKVHAWCSLCMEDLGEVFLLATAIHLWEQHQAKFKGKGEDEAS